jgi:hypothetical protein
MNIILINTKNYILPRRTRGYCNSYCLSRFKHVINIWTRCRPPDCSRNFSDTPSTGGRQNLRKQHRKLKRTFTFPNFQVVDKCSIRTISRVFLSNWNLQFSLTTICTTCYTNTMKNVGKISSSAVYRDSTGSCANRKADLGSDPGCSGRKL